MGQVSSFSEDGKRIPYIYTGTLMGKDDGYSYHLGFDDTNFELYHVHSINYKSWHMEPSTTFQKHTGTYKIDKNKITLFPNRVEFGYELEPSLFTKVEGLFYGGAIGSKRCVMKKQSNGEWTGEWWPDFEKYKGEAIPISSKMTCEFVCETDISDLNAVTGGVLTQYYSLVDDKIDVIGAGSYLTWRFADRCSNPEKIKFIKNCEKC